MLLRKRILKCINPKFSQMEKTRKMHVKKLTYSELIKQWGFEPVALNKFTPKYIRCNAKGEVSFDTAPVYEADELIEKNNVIILK